ncbi:MAG: hypothetical protein WBQ08_23400 [Candidatus Sulfotelmatobacter sp.]
MPLGINLTITVQEPPLLLTLLPTAHVPPITLNCVPVVNAITLITSGTFPELGHSRG